jgi:carbamate kinase
MKTSNKYDSFTKFKDYFQSHDRAIESLANNEKSPLEQLKDTICLHIYINNGVTPQLGAMLLKTIDFIEDEDFENRLIEMNSLTLEITKSMGFTIYNAINELVFDREIDDSILPINNKVLVSLNTVTDDAMKHKDLIMSTIADVINELKNKSW